MLRYRVVARCDGKARAKLATGDKRIPQLGDEYFFFPELGPVTIAKTSFGGGTSIVYVDVTPEVFDRLTDADNWSAVELV